MPNDDSYRCVVEGRVQGVGFRYFVYREAQRLGVFGWVRNRDDGSVELRVEGDPDSVRKFLDKVRAGPSFSYVTNVRMRDVPLEHFEGFSILG
jgi:acylphosphatase